MHPISPPSKQKLPKAHIKYVCLSDLYLGEEDSLLSSWVPNSRKPQLTSNDHCPQTRVHKRRSKMPIDLTPQALADRLERKIQALTFDKSQIIESLNHYVRKLDESSVTVVSTEDTPSFQVFNTDLGTHTLPDGRRIIILADSKCVNYNSGWPRYDHTSEWEGRIWSFDYDNGDPTIWSSIEFGATDNTNIAWEDRSDWYWKVQHTDKINFDTGRQDGHKRWSGWVRFRLSDGSGINIYKITCAP